MNLRPGRFWVFWRGKGGGSNQLILSKAGQKGVVEPPGEAWTVHSLGPETQT